MRGSFLMGLALGALCGVAVLQSSSNAKKLISTGKQMIQEKMQQAGGQQNND